jgi:two-component system phosphate regulon sensor histidine kinase PhoR
MSIAPVLSSPNKTATLVVLVVFLQLIGLSVLGLGAISRDRREGARESLERANADAIADAEGMLQRVRGEFDEVLHEAFSVATPEELQLLRSRTNGRMVDLIYQQEDNGVVRWLTGVQRLWVPARVLEELESREVQASDDVAKQRQRLQAAQKNGAHLEAIQILTSLVTSQALRRDPDSVPSGFPDGLAWTAALLEHAALALEEEKALQPPLRQILLLALETDAINRGRFGAEETEGLLYLDRIQTSVDSITACELDHEALMEMVGDFRRARALLDDLRPALDAAGRRYREMERTTGRALPRLVLQAQGEVFAVERQARLPERLVMVRLLPDEALQIALGRVDQESLARQGTRLEVVRAGGEVVGRPLWQQDLAREGLFELPLRVALYRDRPPPQPAGGRSEAFYLGIIALAAAGLLVGAVVLVRMWRREVRLARLKADFVSNLSHELKTPLTSISLFTEMLQEGKLESEEDKAEGLAVLAQESQRLQRIVARMIEVARREARGTPYDRVAGDLTQPVREAAQRFRRIVTEPGLDLVVQIPPDPLPVLLDSAAMDDAVTNLLSNAWKYKRGDRARIELSVRRRGRKAVIGVVDDGIGIPRSERKRIFEMFYRAENYLTRDVAGTGLGLALVRSIVRAHRGRIRVESGPGGVGTAFTITLPLTRQPWGVPDAQAPAPPVPHTSKAPSAP